MEINETSKTEIPYGYCHCECEQKTKISKETNSKYGWKAGEPFKYIRNHRGKGLDAEPISERFWRHVEKHGPDECWIWDAGRNDRGYGKYFWNGRTIHASWSEEEIRAIRDLYATGTWSQHALARVFHTTQGFIHRIVSGKSRKNG